MYIVSIQVIQNYLMSQDTGILNPLYKILLELGLTDLEVQLYMLSLSLGPSLVARLSGHLKISRPNIYKVIAGLEKHGLAHFSEKKSYGKRFMVESPSKVVELLRERQRQLHTYDQQIIPLMPELLATYKQGELPTKVHVISDRDRLMLAFAQVFEEAKDDISFMGSTDDLDELVTFARLEKHIEQRVVRGVKARVLVFPGHDATLLKTRDVQELRETRFIRGVQPFVTSFYLFANKVIIWQPKAPLAVLIEDKYIVDMQKSIFEKIWGDSK